MYLGYNIVYDLFSIGVFSYIVSSIVYLYMRSNKCKEEDVEYRIILENEKEEKLNKLIVELSLLKVVNKELKCGIEEKSELLKELRDRNDNLSLNIDNIKREYKYLEIECKKLESLNKDKEAYIEELERRLKLKVSELMDLKVNIEYNVLYDIREVLELLSKEYAIEYLKRESTSKYIGKVTSIYKELSMKERYSVSYLLTMYERYKNAGEYDSVLCFMYEKGYLKNGKSMLREEVFKELNDLYEDSMKLESVLESILEM